MPPPIVPSAGGGLGRLPLPGISGGGMQPLRLTASLDGGLDGLKQQQMMNSLAGPAKLGHSKLLPPSSLGNEAESKQSEPLGKLEFK